MNYIDLILIFVILVSAWKGWQKGFIAEIIVLIGWAGSLVAGFFLYPLIARLLESYVFTMGMWTMPISFILGVIISRILIGLLADRVLVLIPETAHPHLANRLFGVVPGLLNGFLYAGLVATFLMLVPMNRHISANSQNSTLAVNLTEKVHWLENKLSPVLNQLGEATGNELAEVPESEKLIKLPYTVRETRVRGDLESKMLEMVNEERKKAGLDPLRPDPELTEVARAHSRDMFSKGYFSHVNLDGKDPFDRMKAAGVTFRTAGENLALAQNLVMAHKGLMESPGHRANILHEAFGRLGIGILDGGIYGIMITQDFRN